MSVGLSLHTVVRVHPETEVWRVGGQFMAATPDGEVHAFEQSDGTVSEVGERIIELVDGSRSVEAIVDVLIDEFEVSREVAERDTRQFIELLLSKKVLQAG